MTRLSLVLLAGAVAVLVVALVQVLTQQPRHFSEVGVTQRAGTPLLTVSNRDDDARGYTALTRVAGRIAASSRFRLRPDESATVSLRTLPANRPVRVGVLAPGWHGVISFTPSDLAP